MNEQLSALMDGELSPDGTRAALARATEQDAIEVWRNYHLIRDVMREGVVLSPQFSRTVLERLKTEGAAPILPGSERPHARVEPRAWLNWPMAASVAASLAGVALVSWLALGPVSDSGRGAPQARLAAPTAIAQSSGSDAGSAATPLTESARDYLLAHQRFSPRGSLQGVAPYVRTVSTQALVAEPR